MANQNTTNKEFSSSVNDLSVVNTTRLSPKELIFKYVAFLPLFILTTAICFGIAYIYIRYKVPKFTSYISLLIKDDDKNRRSGSEDMLLDIGLFSRKSNLANEVEVIKSTILLEDVVKELKLNTQLFSEGKIKKTELYGKYKPFYVEFLDVTDSTSSIRLSFTKTGDSSITIKLGNRSITCTNGQIVKQGAYTFRFVATNWDAFDPKYKYYAEWHPIQTTALILASKLKVKQLSKEASILTLSIDDEIAEKSRDVLNTLIYVYNKVNINEKNKTIENTISFIDDRLLVLSGELEKVETGLQNFREIENLYDLSGQTDMEIQKLKEYSTKLNEIEIQRNIINMLSSYINDASKKYTLVPSTLGIQDLTLTQLINAYNETVLKREEYLKSIPIGNILIVTLESQIDQLKTKISENLKNISASYNSIYNQQKSDYVKIIANLKSIPSRQKQLIEIARQQGIKEKLYLYLLQKREESAISKASAVASSKYIDPAISSLKPVSPDTKKIYSIAAIFSLLLPLAIIYIKDLFNDKLTTRNDITKIIEAPIVGEIAHHQTTERAIVMGGKSRSLIAEQFRIIRTNLQYLNNSKESRVILVTSTMAGEGKTFISMNLAAVLSLSGKKTVVLEFDMRKPKIAKSLGFDNVFGLTDFFIGRKHIDEIVQPISGFESLSLIPCGIIPPNPAELILSEKMNELFSYLKTHFDYIIIDSAPIGLVSDAKVFALQADISLYVARQRYTQKKQLNFIQDIYASKILPNMALIINDVTIGGVNSYYGYGYSYGYGSYSYKSGYSYDYSYGYGYGDDRKLSKWKKIISLFKNIN
jgi:capsular exopolysaccharide synthesis family protein